MHRPGEQHLAVADAGDGEVGVIPGKPQRRVPVGGQRSKDVEKLGRVGRVAVRLQRRECRRQGARLSGQDVEIVVGLDPEGRESVRLQQQHERARRKLLQCTAEWQRWTMFTSYIR